MLNCTLAPQIWHDARRNKSSRKRGIADEDLEPYSGLMSIVREHGAALLGAMSAPALLCTVNATLTDTHVQHPCTVNANGTALARCKRISTTTYK